MAKKIEIAGEAKIKFGTMINVRTFKLGKKSSIGFFTLVKGESDLIVGDACIIGPRTTINCSKQVVLDYYSGVGPGSYLYTHGSGMPVTEGYRATFGPIHIKSKVWISMRCTIGPGVTIEEGTNIMPGSIILESIGRSRLVVGNPAKLNNIPVFLIPQKPGFLDEVAADILEKFCDWSNEYEGTDWHVTNSTLWVDYKKRRLSISLNNTGDIVLLTNEGATQNGMYFNLADLRTDEYRHPVKLKLEKFIRLYYGLIFL